MIYDSLVVLVGLIAIVASIRPTLTMIQKLPEGSTLTLWKILFALIVFFAISYTVMLFMLPGVQDQILKSVVIYMLLGGGFFVWIITRVSVDSIGVLEKIIVLERQSTRDGLMGIYNRRYLDIRLNEEFSRARRYKTDLSFMMLDVDHFKTVNDQFGHDIGDKVLMELADILKREVRESDIIARYGGEEIAIICPLTNKQSTRLLAERLCTVINDEVSISLDSLTEFQNIKSDSNAHNITVSIGVSCINDDQNDAFDLVKQADKALYRAKDNGRNMVIMDCENTRVSRRGS